MWIQALVAVLLLAALAFAVRYVLPSRRGRRSQPGPAGPAAAVAEATETFESPAPPHAGSPLAPYLDRAVDASLPPDAAGESVAFARDEVKAVLQRVVQRINARSPGLELTLVSFDNVKKVVDVYKTLKYEADVQVHSVAKSFSSRITARVDVASDGKEYVRSLAVHNATVDAGGPRPASDPAVGSHERYAAFEPAVFRYVPKV